MSAWAKHFRKQYCDDGMLDELRAGTGKSRKQFLEDLIFPDSKEAPGPSVRAGDFAEILAADYLEFVLNHWVPRTKLDQKAVRNESVKGSDIIGFKILKEGSVSKFDVLTVVESKARLSAGVGANKLQEAIDSSAKDIAVRRSETLHAIKRRLLADGSVGEAKRVQRFQNKADNPYKETNGAVAVLCTSGFDSKSLAETKIESHPNYPNLLLLVFHAKDILHLAQTLFRRAADEA